ncbi:MAG: cysteine protease StiP domain-containing protein [Dysosmobacter welbionis]
MPWPYLLNRHAPGDIQFVDGWTGKGAIQRQLDAAMTDYPGVSPGLTVLSDPANVAAICGTHDDFLIASSCLNSTVSGLLSRTFLRRHHRPRGLSRRCLLPELKDQDLTYQFIDTIQAHFPACADAVPRPGAAAGRTGGVHRIGADFSIRTSISSSPSIGEATRVLLRRVPWKVLVHSLRDEAHLGQSTNWPGRRAWSWWSIPGELPGLRPDPGPGGHIAMGTILFASDLDNTLLFSHRHRQPRTGVWSV